MKKVEKNSYGFYSFVDKPSPEELQEYYNTKYYQGARGSYELSYSPAEVEHFLNKIEEKVFVASKFVTLSEQSKIVDLGCGEGWVLRYFKDRGIKATGLDFSSYGCEKFNPDCSPQMLVGDVYKNIEKLISEGKTYDLVWLDNVLEHVIDPFDLLRQCHRILAPKGVLMVEVPNDFSVLQNYLLEGGFIDTQYWVAYPDHLSYFNREGLNNLAESAGLKPVFAMGDFPIDFNLLNPNTNYSRNKATGKSCYQSKFLFENLVHNISVEKTVNLYKALMDLGIGRCIAGFFVKS